MNLEGKNERVESLAEWSAKHVKLYSELHSVLMVVDFSRGGLKYSVHQDTQCSVERMVG